MANLEEQDLLIDAFLESKGLDRDVARIVADASLAKRLFARLGLVGDTLEAQRQGGQTSLEAPHCHGRFPDGSHRPQTPCPGFPACHGIMTSQKKRDKWRWECGKTMPGSPRCKNSMTSTPGARTSAGAKGSMLFGSKIKENDLFCLIRYFVLGASHTFIKNATGLSSEVITNYTTMIKEVMTNSVLNSYEDLPDEPGKIGGPGKIVEIDETKIARRKSGVGHLLARELDWVFGGICRSDNRSFKCRVPGRAIRDLIPLMKRFIAPGSVIVSDGWLAYQYLDVYASEMNWTHYWVNHSENFVCEHQEIPMPTDSQTEYQSEQVHTQKIERHWRDLKSTVRYFSDVNGAVDRDLQVHTYIMDNFGRGVNAISVRARVVRLIRDCAKVYPLSGAERPLPEWVHFNISQEEWQERTGRTKVLTGYMMEGIGYLDMVDLGAHEPEMPEHHFNDALGFQHAGEAAFDQAIGADDAIFPV